MLSVSGRIDVHRTRWQQAKGGSPKTEALPSPVPVDALLDRVHATVSLGVQELCCRLGIAGGSLERSAENLFRASGLRIGEESFRQIIENEGRAILEAAHAEVLPTQWVAKDCLTPDSAGKEVSRVYVSADGVMVPVTTQAEKDRRRETVEKRRSDKPKQRGVRRGRLRAVKKGADQRYKQHYLTVIYGQDKKKHKLVSVTRGNHESMGRVLARDSRVLRLAGAQEKIGLVDGAVCLRRNLEGLTLTAVGLDFFHLSEHVHADYLECGDPAVPGKVNGVKKRKAARQTMPPEAPKPEGSQSPAWVSDVLSTAKHEGYAPFWDKLVKRRNGLKGSRRTKADKLLHYVAQREEMIAYDKFGAKGWDIGTGPMESMCKATTRRIKGPGMRWDAENAESLMAMEGLYQSNLWDAWWAQKHGKIAA